MVIMAEKAATSKPIRSAPTVPAKAAGTAKSTAASKTVKSTAPSHTLNVRQMQSSAQPRLLSPAIKASAKNAMLIPNTTHKIVGVIVKASIKLKIAAVIPKITLAARAIIVQSFLLVQLQLQLVIFSPPIQYMWLEATLSALKARVKICIKVFYIKIL